MGIDKQDTARPSLGLIGFGAFGRLVAATLVDHFDLTVCDPGYVQATLPDGRLCRMGTLADVARLDVVVMAVPVARLHHLCTTLAPLLSPGTLVLDVGSVKVEPVAIMQELLPDHVDIVATHPLFGPQSAKDGVEGHKVVLCPVRGQRLRSVARVLRRLGLKVIVECAEAHDREAAMVQGLTHLIAKVLVGLGPLPERMTTASFDLLREAVGMVKDDPPTVLHAIEVANPYSAEVREAFFAHADTLRAHFDADRERNPKENPTA
ncbi:prephenate dehydrogenase [Shimia gijangensis]|uniref:Prephenate dehydrogenase n=1 Tax=Shimia gijangensis TaxID=1470563 RepID=A0A1M6IAC2_9RHOB|nr:prephenate dehydrogenase [Shimia gijangensis]SHJ31345.1 prephenate dehydrogenase [Shimia gijangensis]